MNFISKFALVGCAAFAALGSAQAASIQFYEVGSMFTSVGAGGTITSTPPTVGTATAANSLVVTGGGNTVTIRYETADSSGAPQNLNSGSNAAYGFFNVDSTNLNGGLLTIPAFTFNLQITDVTDGGTVNFTGTSSGGQIGFVTSGGTTSGTDTVVVNWSPTSATDLTSVFNIVNFSGLVVPTVSANYGETTIQGQVISLLAPEPASMVLMGAGLLGLGFLSRRKLGIKK